ncbi:MAG: hypothetical protein HW403_1101, partial [Dehalococcoidia bacterium]|nr:hypothetical protein [Dehalococcoidia bacterium]
WVIPSLVFKKYCTQAKEVYDLDLDLRPRDRDTIRKELLAPYKNNWDLLTRTIEDLGDLMAMYESLAAPEEESMTLAEYEALRRKRV